ncbi:hypothetical protein TFLX_02667 [Thermoflexales bacterium]|nr:hypothetical protein TFLX_02667 [Thermoflexales bacterium]
MQLLVSDHTVMEIDALQVGERYFFSNVSVGISPQMMNDTTSADKKVLGRLAYVLQLFAVRLVKVWRLSHMWPGRVG